MVKKEQMLKKVFTNVRGASPQTSLWTSKGAENLNSELRREFLHFATMAMFTKMWNILRVEK